jgi:hypothetical protein
LSGYQFLQEGFFYEFPVAAGFDNPSCKYKASSITKQCCLTVTNQQSASTSCLFHALSSNVMPNRSDNSATFSRVHWDLLRDALLLEPGLGKSRQDSSYIIRRVFPGMKCGAEGRLGAQLGISIRAQNL